MRRLIRTGILLVTIPMGALPTPMRRLENQPQPPEVGAIVPHQVPHHLALAIVILMHVMMAMGIFSSTKTAVVVAAHREVQDLGDQHPAAQAPVVVIQEILVVVIRDILVIVLRR